MWAQSATAAGASSCMKYTPRQDTDVFDTFAYSPLVSRGGASLAPLIYSIDLAPGTMLLLASSCTALLARSQKDRPLPSDLRCSTGLLLRAAAEDVGI